MDLLQDSGSAGNNGRSSAPAGRQSSDGRKRPPSPPNASDGARNTKRTGRKRLPLPATSGAESSNSGSDYSDVDEKMPSAKTECKTNVKKARGPTRQQKKEDTIELDDSSSSSGTSKEGSEGSEDDPLCCYDLMIYDKNQECMDDDDFEPFDCPGDKTELVKCRGPRCDEYFHPCCLNYVKKLWPKTIDGFCVICNKGLPGAIVCDIPQCIVKYNPDKPFHYCQTKGCFNTFHEQCYDDCHKGSRSGLGSDYEFCLDCEQKKLPKESNARSPEKNDQTSEQDDINAVMGASPEGEGDSHDQPRQDNSADGLDAELQTAFQGQRAFRGNAGLDAQGKRRRLKELTMIDASRLFTRDRQ